MVLLIASWPVAHQHAVAYALLLAATACLGAGFGLTVPSLNTLAAAFHPAAVDKSVLVLNALLGLGTALAPAFVAAFVGFGFWIGLPLLAAGLLSGLDRRSACACPFVRYRPGRRRFSVDGTPASGRVLDVRGVRRPVRVLRDDERQLVRSWTSQSLGGERRPRPSH